MMTRRSLFYGLALAAAPASIASAKRLAPKPVKPVRDGGVEYRASFADPMSGEIEAWDLARKQRLWSRQIYVVKYIPPEEADVQWVHITQMKLDGQKMHITNESGSEYELDVTTLAVKVIKGNLVEQQKG